jgi:acyl-CoA synthetase (AMP-forming)/AMP-acid ligase II
MSRIIRSPPGTDSAENISAREIEDLLAAHPAVEEVVLGVPDAAAGEIACAVLRLRAGAPSLDDVTRHLLARGLSKRTLPERVAVVDDFPRTASGKVLKRALRDRVVSGT